MSERKVALITGASGGIGAELAKVFAAEGHDLILVARGKAAMEALGAELAKAHGAKVDVIAADLGDHEARVALGEQLRGRRVDVLVNNAGFGLAGPFGEDGKRELDMIELNITALTHLSQLFLPQMKARKSGGILHVASTAAFQPGPLMAVYYASKAYVLSLSEAQRIELEGTGVVVSCLCPGATATGFASAAGNADTPLFTKNTVMDAATVARAGYDGLKQGRGVVIPGLKNRVMALGAALGPRAVAARIAMKMNAKG